MSNGCGLHGFGLCGRCRQHRVAEGGCARLDCLTGGGGIDQETIKGQRIDDQQAPDLIGMTRTEHQRHFAAHGMTDDGRRRDMCAPNVIGNCLGPGRGHPSIWIGDGRRSRKTRDLHEVESMVLPQTDGKIRPIFRVKMPIQGSG